MCLLWLKVKEVYLRTTAIIWRGMSESLQRKHKTRSTVLTSLAMYFKMNVLAVKSETIKKFFSYTQYSGLQQTKFQRSFTVQFNSIFGLHIKVNALHFKAANHWFFSKNQMTFPWCKQKEKHLICQEILTEMKSISCLFLSLDLS